MSRAFLRAEAAAELGTFTKLLPRVEEPKAELKAVRGRTAEILQKLRDTAVAEGRAEGYMEGFAEGQQEAFAATRQAMEGAVQEFRAALDAQAERVQAAMAQWYDEAEEELAALAVAVAARALGRELTLAKDCVTDLAREALRAVAAADRVCIRVHPFDAKVLIEEKARLLAASPTVRGVEIVDDPTMEGGAKIESDAGVIDATLRTQLELAFEALRRAP